MMSTSRCCARPVVPVQLFTPYSIQKLCTTLTKHRIECSTSKYKFMPFYMNSSSGLLVTLNNSIDFANVTNFLFQIYVECASNSELNDLTYLNVKVLHDPKNVKQDQYRPFEMQLASALDIVDIKANRIVDASQNSFDYVLNINNSASGLESKRHTGLYHCELYRRR